MSSHIVKCPHCGATRSVTQNSLVNCQSCGASLYIDNNGNIKRSKPKK